MRPCAALLLVSLVGCGARTDLDPADGPSGGGRGGEGGGPACPGGMLPCEGTCCEGVCDEGRCLPPGDCARLAPHARVIATLKDPTDLDSLADDDTHLYYVSEGALFRHPKSGGGPELLASAVNDGDPASLAIDASHAFLRGAGSLVRLPKVGGSVEVFAAPAQIPWARSLALGATMVALTALDDASTPTLHFISKAGGRSHVAFFPPPGQTWAASADADAAYWLSSFHLHRVPFDGGPPTHLPIPSALWGPNALTLDAGFAYMGVWSEEKDSVIARLNVAFGDEMEILARGLPLAIDVTGADIYALARVPEDPPETGSLVRVVPGRALRMADIDFIEDTGAFSYRSAAIASDESGVYFIDPCFRTPPEPQVYKLVHLPRDTGEP